MRIGIDISPASKQHKTGIEWYCYHIAKEFIKIGIDHDYIYYTKHPVCHEFGGLPSNFREVVLPDRAFWTHTSLARELIRSPVDVFYSPSHIIPWRHPRRTVSTIHDAGFRHYRKNYSFYQFMHASANSYTSAKWATKIIVPAEFVARDIAQLYNLERRSIEIVPNGFDAGEFDAICTNEIDAAKHEAGLKGKYLIFVGRLEERKNIIRVLEAFGSLLKEVGPSIQLLLVGSRGVGYESIAATRAALPNGHLVVETGYLPKRQKACLLAGAAGLIFPSLYEGFGIPILEGFAAGIPVVTSNLTACPEVAGEAALIVDPFSVSDIKDAMKRCLLDESLRSELISKGHLRVRDFSWQKTARLAHDVLMQVLEKSESR